jgi:hypothetical protein
MFEVDSFLKGELTNRAGKRRFIDLVGRVRVEITFWQTAAGTPYDW